MTVVRKKNNLKKVREERLMSKAELARAAEVSVMTITRIEGGAPSQPRTKRKILGALDIPLENRATVFPGGPDS